MHRMCCLESSNAPTNPEEAYPLQQKDFSPKSVTSWNERPWEIREFLVSSLLHLFGPPWAASPQATGLDLANEMVGMGLPVPWLGFLSDLVTWAQGNPLHRQSITPSLKSHAVQKSLQGYRNRVIGLLTSDRNCLSLRKELASQSQGQQVRSLAWLMAQWHEASLWEGKTLVPGQIASLKSQTASSLEAKAISLWDSASVELLQNMIDMILGTSDRFTNSRSVYQKHYLQALETGHSSLQLAQYTGLRQIQKARESLFTSLYWEIAHDPAARQEIDNRHVLDDEFPIGGYSSISNKGRFESLLPSQLALWDEPVGETDLFTWKYTRDELWYYSRDENAIRKPPLEVAILLWPGISEARTYDREIGFQSLTVLLATLLEAISLVESHRESHALKIRWIFQEETSNPSGGINNGQSQLKGLLRVLLGTRILQEQHAVESLSRGDIEALLQPPRKNGDFRAIQCHPVFPGTIFPGSPDEFSIYLGLDGCLPRIISGGMELTPNPKHIPQRYSWIANILALWCQSPLGTPFREGVLIPISG